MKEKEKKDTYCKLNADTIKKIGKNIDNDVEEEKTLRSTLKRYEEDAMNVMLIPVLKRHAVKYHAKHDKFRKRAKKKQGRRESRSTKSKARVNGRYVRTCIKKPQSQ